MQYRIKIKGKLEESWSDWLYDAAISSKGEENGAIITTITVSAIDQPALFGILDRIRDMNLLPISVEMIDEEK
jgi:hypothetical protein